MLKFGSQSLAYVVIQPSNQGGLSGKIAAVCEYAGSRNAIVGAISWIFERYGVEKLLIWVSPFDVELQYLLNKLGLKSEIGDLPGHTIRMVDFPRLCEKIRPYFEVHLGCRKAELLKFKQENDVFTVEFQGQRLQFDSRMIVRLVFGSVEEAVKMPDVGELTAILRRIFPIPFPWPGLEAF
jgi:hypothetical protein